MLSHRILIYPKCRGELCSPAKRARNARPYKTVFMLCLHIKLVIFCQVYCAKGSFAKKTVQKVLTSKLGYAILNMSRKLGVMFGQKIQSKLIQQRSNTMNKEEILAKAQKENKNLDLAELEVIGNSEQLAGGVSGILCFILYVAEAVITGNDNYALWGILSTYIAVNSIYKGIKLKKKGSVIFGAVWAVIAIVSVITAVVSFIGTGRVA